MRDRSPFAFAGLWARWISPDHEVLDSCTILTTRANELIAPVHDRMPVIVSPADYDHWLDPAVQDRRPLEHILRPYPAADMETYAVSRRVNNVREDDAALLEPAA